MTQARATNDAAAKVARSSLGEPGALRLRLRTPVSVRKDLTKKIEKARESKQNSTYTISNNSRNPRGS